MIDTVGMDFFNGTDMPKATPSTSTMTSTNVTSSEHGLAFENWPNGSDTNNKPYFYDDMNSDPKRMKIDSIDPGNINGMTVVTQDTTTTQPTENHSVYMGPSVDSVYYQSQLNQDPSSLVPNSLSQLYNTPEGISSNTPTITTGSNETEMRQMPTSHMMNTSLSQGLSQTIAQQPMLQDPNIQNVSLMNLHHEDVSLSIPSTMPHSGQGQHMSIQPLHQEQHMILANEQPQHLLPVAPSIMPLSVDQEYSLMTTEIRSLNSPGIHGLEDRYNNVTQESQEHPVQIQHDHSLHREHSLHQELSNHSLHQDHSLHQELSNHSLHQDHSLHQELSNHSLHQDHSLHQELSNHSFHQDHSLHQELSNQSFHQEHSHPPFQELSHQSVPDRSPTQIQSNLDSRKLKRRHSVTVMECPNYNDLKEMNGELESSDSPTVTATPHKPGGAYFKLLVGPGKHQVKEFNILPVNVVRLEYTAKSSDYMVVKLICDKKMNKPESEIFITAVSAYHSQEDPSNIYFPNLKISQQMLRGRTKGFNFRLKFVLVVDGIEVEKVESEEFYLWSNVNQKGFPREERDSYVSHKVKPVKKRRRR